MFKKKWMSRFLSLGLAFSLLFCPAVRAAEDAEVQTPESYTVIKALRNYIHRYYQFDVTDEELLDALIKEILLKDDSAESFKFVADALTSALDKHSMYFTPAETEKFTEDVSAEFAGVGIPLVNIDGYCTVMSILPNTAAVGSGLVPGDKIIAVNGENVVNTDVDLIVKKVRGAEGTAVTLTILSENGNTWDVTLTRSTVVTPSADYKLNSAKDTAYVVISQFGADTAAQFDGILHEVKDLGIKKMIIDLRNNTGGFTDQAYKMATEFLKDGTVVYQESSRSSGLTHEYTSRNPAPDTEMQLVILVNDYTASASEIFTGAMKDNGRATIIGIKTFGKGTVQTVTGMGDYGSIKLTIAEFMSPSGATINGVGITPDICVENTTRPVEDSDLLPLSLSVKYQIGDNNKEVCAIKQRLSYLGLYSGDVDSPVFDKDTDLAIRRFQQYSGLYPYGVADINTQLTLQTEVKNGELVMDNQLTRAYQELGTVE